MPSKKSLQKIKANETWQAFKKRTREFVTATAGRNAILLTLDYSQEIIEPPHILLNLIPSALAGKCLGILQCAIDYANVNGTERINFVGISGLDGKGTNKCLSQVNNLVQGLTQEHHQTIASIISDTSIYGPLKGTTVDWAAGFYEEIKWRLPKYFRALLEELQRQNVNFDDTDDLSRALLAYHEDDAMFSRLMIGENLINYIQFVRRLRDAEQRNVDLLLYNIRHPPEQVLLENWYRGDRNTLRVHLDRLAQVLPANLEEEAITIAKTLHRVLHIPKNAVPQNVKDSVVDMAAVLMAAASPVENPTKNSALADIFVQCAEDAATGALVEHLRGKRPTRIVATWTSTTILKIKGGKILVHKPLCPFCASRFEQRFCDVADALCSVHVYAPEVVGV